MKLLLIAAAVAACAFGLFVLYRHLAMRRHNDEIGVVRVERVKVLLDKLEKGQDVAEQDVRPFAENVLTREAAFALLDKHGKLNLFPKEYLTLIRGAESDLANWLEFPTELDACPDEIEHIKRVTIFGEPERHYYEVFKYRVNAPHWAADDGWMLGVVGPFFDDSEPYDFPGATFSRIQSMEGGTTPEEEARWVHDNVYKKFR